MNEQPVPLEVIRRAMAPRPDGNGSDVTALLGAAGLGDALAPRPLRVAALDVTWAAILARAGLLLPAMPGREDNTAGSILPAWVLRTTLVREQELVPGTNVIEVAYAPVLGGYPLLGPEDAQDRMWATLADYCLSVDDAARIAAMAAARRIRPGTPRASVLTLSWASRPEEAPGGTIGLLSITLDRGGPGRVLATCVPFGFHEDAAGRLNEPPRVCRRLRT